MQPKKGVELVYNRKAFKQEAKQLMRASVPHFMLVALVYCLLTSGLSTAVSWVTSSGTFGIDALSIFLTILVALFSIVMGVGFCNYALRLARREETGMGSLFHAFSFAGRSIGMALLVALFTFLWCLLVLVVFAIVVGILFAVSAVTESGVWAVLMIVLVVVLYIGLIVAVVAISLRYAMADFALVDDPGAGAMTAIRRSVQMMRGYKGKLFVLELSFIGWELLVGLIAAAVMVIGFLISGTSWLVEAILAAGDDLWEIYSLAGNLVGQMAIWTLLAELVSLPLNLWLLVYRQTALARFYNYVGGYDYHQYMNQRPADPGVPLEPPQPTQPPAGGDAPWSSGPEEPRAEPEEPRQPETPHAPDNYYTSILPPEPPGGEPEESDEDEEI